MSKNLNRRDFLKVLGSSASVLGAAYVAPNIIGKTSRGYLVES